MLDPTKTKRCPSCEAVKPHTEFYRRSGEKAHLPQSWCIECTTAYRRARLADPEIRERERQVASDRAKAARIVARHHALEVELHQQHIAQQRQEA